MIQEWKVRLSAISKTINTKKKLRSPDNFNNCFQWTLMIQLFVCMYLHNARVK
ncbi:unnamed protein product [Tenebrio molitor]|nr:unnamed protein product [Tenebrio molitor]